MGFALEEFSEQLSDFLACFPQSTAPSRGGPVGPARRSPRSLLCGTQQPPPFEAVEQRVDGSGAQPIAVSREFFDDAEAEDRLQAGMMQDVESDQARVEVPVSPIVSVLCHRSSPAPSGVTKQIE